MPNPDSTTTDQDLETFDSLDDLQIEDESAPSIDDFEINSSGSDVAHPNTENKDEWYAITLGQELGPFPFEELVEMVADGEVSPTDQIRYRRGGQWVQAGDIDGLFPEVDQDDDFELGEDVQLKEGQSQAEQNAQTSKGGVQVFGGNINHTLNDSQQVRERNRHQKELFEQQARERQTREAAEAEAAAQAAAEQPTPEEKEQARKQEIANQLNSWLNERVQTEEPQVDDEPEQRPEPAAQPSSSGSTSSYSDYDAVSAPYTPPSAPSAPRTTIKTKQQKKPKGESVFSKLGGMFGSMGGSASAVDPKIIGGIVGAALLVGLFFVPMPFGGTNDAEIEKRFREIYTMIQNNPQAISSQSQSLVPEVKETVKALIENGAGASRPYKQELMRIGRDCLLPLINNPESLEGPMKDRIESHFKTIEKLK